MKDWTVELRQAFVDHLLAGGAELLEETIRGGGTTRKYAACWQRGRDAAARAMEISPELADQVLALPTEWGGTVREFLLCLLKLAWPCAESNRYYGLTGNSDWQYEVYSAMATAGIIPSWRDGYGLTGADQRRADRIVYAAIERLAPPDPGGGNPSE